MKLIRVRDWEVSIYKWMGGICFDLRHMVGDRPAGRYFTLKIRKEFKIGDDHLWYDGEHCKYDLGWLEVCKSWGWCQKCYDESH